MSVHESHRVAVARPTMSRSDDYLYRQPLRWPAPQEPPAVPWSAAQRGRPPARAVGEAK